MCTSFLIRHERAQRTQTIEFSSLAARWSHLILTLHFTELDLCALCFLDKPKTEALFTWRRQNSPTSQVPGACILPLDLERPAWPWFHPFSFFWLPLPPSHSFHLTCLGPLAPSDCGACKRPPGDPGARPPTQTLPLGSQQVTVESETEAERVAQVLLCNRQHQVLGKRFQRKMLLA